MPENLLQWNRSSDCCTWDEVTCDEDGRVIGLNLRSKGIHGVINYSSLSSLQHLKILDLSYNIFGSKIPARIGNLTNLKLQRANTNRNIKAKKIDRS
ncbi:LRR domain containing protein [Trema orientale]|uniref:LRR domain containing protein n=1 Tax=Trema orientale TaxID=63057 RepID=A0A2P5F964_TREOI|nr:LRR domain containing protein [Trema orientale]